MLQIWLWRRIERGQLRNIWQKVEKEQEECYDFLLHSVGGRDGWTAVLYLVSDYPPNLSFTVWRSHRSWVWPPLPTRSTSIVGCRKSHTMLSFLNPGKSSRQSKIHSSFWAAAPTARDDMEKRWSQLKVRTSMNVSVVKSERDFA